MPICTIKFNNYMGAGIALQIKNKYPEGYFVPLPHTDIVLICFYFCVSPAIVMTVSINLLISLAGIATNSLLRITIIL